MRRDEILRFLRAQPFRPFRLLLSNGTAYEIRHPDMAIATPSAIYVGVPVGAGNEAADDIVVVSLIHVVQMDHLPTATSPSTN